MKPVRESPVLTTVVQTSLYLTKLLAIWFFFKGHQEPGGGFVAGVIIAGAIALQGLTFGRRAAEAVMPVPFPLLLGAGLALAVGSVVLPALLGYPFFKSAYGYIGLPLIGEVEWATAAVFDLGVLLVVVGSVKSVLLHIEDEKIEEAGPAERGGD